jgi:predicted O-methyltransferase YrrM
VQIYQPKSILELGVAAGGGTSVLLNAAKGYSTGDVTITSIDFAKTMPASAPSFKRYMNDNKPANIGFIAHKYLEAGYADNVAWNLFAGKDVSQILVESDMRFDFVVLDTAHHHPCESLNFLSVLPFLNDGAIVVLHDLRLSMSNLPKLEFYANITLFDSVVGEKITPLKDANYEFPNIGAVRITADTRKYIENVFYSLRLKWEYMPPAPMLHSVGDIIKKHYPEKLRKIYSNCYDVWFSYFYKDIAKLTQILDNNKSKKIIIWGASNLFEHLKAFGIRYDELWDGYKKDSGITSPDISSLNENCFVLICVESRNSQAEIESRLDSCGFENYVAWNSIIE